MKISQNAKIGIAVAVAVAAWWYFVHEKSEHAPLPKEAFESSESFESFESSEFEEPEEPEES